MIITISRATFYLLELVLSIILRYFHKISISYTSKFKLNVKTTIQQ